MKTFLTPSTKRKLLLKRGLTTFECFVYAIATSFCFGAMFLIVHFHHQHINIDMLNEFMSDLSK